MRAIRFLALSLALNLIAFGLPAFGAPASNPAYQAAVKRFMELTDKQSIAALANQTRGANRIIPKLISEIEDGTQRKVDVKAALAEALTRNGYKDLEHTLTFHNIYGNWNSLRTFTPAALSPANLTRLEAGQAVTLHSHDRRTSKTITQMLDVDHTIPVNIVPELGTKLHNLRLLAHTPNRSIKHAVSEEALVRAEDLLQKKLISKQHFDAVKAKWLERRELAREATRGEVSALPRSAQATQGRYSPPTYENAQRQLKTYGTIPGGVLLEGALAAVPPITAAKFAPASDEVLLNGKIRYALPIPKSEVAAIFAAVARDDRIGVSLPSVFNIGLNEVYGAVPLQSMVARNLTLADAFLGAIVFGNQPDWLDKYRLAPGHVREEDITIAMSVNFTIHGFEGEIRQNRLHVVRTRFTVTFVPHEKGPNGEAVPLASPEKLVSAKLTAVGKHVADNIDYYRDEPIVDLAFRYGEVAALARKLRESGANLDAIASSIR